VNFDTPWHQRLRTRRSGEGPAVSLDGTVRVQGEREWIFSGPPAEVQLVVDALPGVAEPMGESLVLLSFGNAVGYFEIKGLGRVEVVSGKWKEQHFDIMLRDLTEVAVNLPFSAGDGAALPFDRSVALHEEVLYHAFAYLRSVLIGHRSPDDRLDAVLWQVIRDPHRRFTPVARSVPLGAARALSPRGLSGMFHSDARLLRVPAGAAAALPLTRALQGYLPEQVTETAIVASIDTPENRFVKSFLSLCEGTISGVERRVEQGRGAFSRGTLTDCEALRSVLAPIARHPMWAEVGPMVHFPASSTVLQRRRGYREVLRHWVRLRAVTRLPLSSQQSHRLLEIKDIAELYELWCFFSLVRAVESRMGPPSEAASLRSDVMQVTAPWDFRVSWPDGTQLTYNPRFNRSNPAGRRSYSVPLRPDIGLHVASGPNQGLHLLDAKFRVDLAPLQTAAAAEEPEDQEAADERRGVFKRGDLYKMHTYRDAVEAARSVWILYPGTAAIFYGSDGEVASDLVKLPACMVGVGAVPHLPEEGDKTPVQELISRLIPRDDLLSGEAGLRPA
jgi:uncharacterized protein